jgi:hypothetical protein
MAVTYAIVEFLTNKNVDVIPTSWFVNEEEEECFWPKVPSKLAEKLARERAESSIAWPKYSVRVLGKAGKNRITVTVFVNFTYMCIFVLINHTYCV